MIKELYLFILDHLISYIVYTHLHKHRSALVHKCKHLIFLWLCACDLRPKIKAQHYVLSQHLGETRRTSNGLTMHSPPHSGPTDEVSYPNSPPYQGEQA